MILPNVAIYNVSGMLTINAPVFRAQPKSPVTLLGASGVRQISWNIDAFGITQNNLEKLFLFIYLKEISK